jgi:hypothetical protein
MTKTKEKNIRKLLTYFIEGYNVTTLNILIDGLNGKIILNHIVNRNQIIDNSKHNLQFLDTVPNWNKFGYESNKLISEPQKIASIV